MFCRVVMGIIGVNSSQTLRFVPGAQAGVVTIRGQVPCLCGVSPGASSSSECWLIGTNDIQRDLGGEQGCVDRAAC